MSFILPINFCVLVWTKKPECDLVIVRLNDKMKLHTVIYCKWTWCCRTCHIIIKLISFCIRWRHSVNAGACRGFGGYIHRRCRQEKGCKYIGVSIHNYLLCLLIAFAPSKNDKQLSKEHMEKYTLQRIIHLRSNLTLLTNYDYKDTHNFVFNVLYEH